MTNRHVFDYDAPDFEAFTKPSRTAKREPKVDKVTQDKLDALSDSNAMLSQTNLALNGLIRRMLLTAPGHLQKEYRSTYDAIRDGQLTEVSS